MAIRPCQQMLHHSTSVTRRRIFDRLAQAVITMGGIAVILSIICIFIFLVKEVVPVFFSPQGTQTGHVAGAPPPGSLPQSSLVGMDEYQEIIYQLMAGSDRQIRFFNAQSGAPITLDLPPALAKVHVTAIARAVGTGNRFAFGTDDGRIIPVTIEFTAGYEEGARHIVPTVTLGAPVQLTPAKEQIIRLAYQPTERGTLALALTDHGRLWYTASPLATVPVALTGHGAETVTAVIFDSRGETLSVGTANGNLYHFDVREGTQPSLIETTSVAPSGTSVTALSYLIGDRSLVIGTSAGDVSVWMPVRQDSRKLDDSLSSDSSVRRASIFRHRDLSIASRQRIHHRRYARQSVCPLLHLLTDFVEASWESAGDSHPDIFSQGRWSRGPHRPGRIAHLCDSKPPSGNHDRNPLQARLV